MGRNYDGIRGYAVNAISQNTQLRQNPQYAEMIRAIEENDAQAGIALANQILQRNNISQGEAINRAIQFFGLSNGGR